MIIDGPSLMPGNSITNRLDYWQFDKDIPPSLIHRIDMLVHSYIIMNSHLFLLDVRGF